MFIVCNFIYKYKACTPLLAHILFSRGSLCIQLGVSILVKLRTIGTKEYFQSKMEQSFNIQLLEHVGVKCSKLTSILHKGRGPARHHFLTTYGLQWHQISMMNSSEMNCTSRKEVSHTLSLPKIPLLHTNSSSLLHGTRMAVTQLCMHKSKNLFCHGNCLQ